MYSDYIKNLVFKMVDKLRSEDENMCLMNAARRVSFLTDIDVTTITGCVSNKSSATSKSTKLNKKRKVTRHCVACNQKYV